MQTNTFCGERSYRKTSMEIESNSADNVIWQQRGFGPNEVQFIIIRAAAVVA